MSSIAQRASGVARHLFAMGEGRLQIGRGVRTAFALIVPVVVGDLIAQPLFSWAALGGWLGSLADKGGSYRTRAATMGAFAILGSACTFAGTDAARSLPLAVVSMLVVGIAGGHARVYGDEGSTVGLFIAVIYAVAVGSPSALSHAPLLRAEMFAGGAAWAMFLSLLLWPLHPFRPARRAIAESYRVLAKLALALASVSRALGDQNAGAARDRAGALHASVRSALENARVVLADVRRRKQGRSPLLTYGRRMASTMAAIAESRASGEMAAPESAVAALALQLDALADALDGPAARAAPAQPISDASSVLSIAGESASASELGAQSLQGARLERLRAQLSVMQRAVARYLAA